MRYWVMGLWYDMACRTGRRAARVCRWSRTRGFGVQSPWAYRFLQEVISEKHGEVPIGDLLLKWQDENKTRKSLAQLYFRISKDWNVASWGLYLPQPLMSMDFIKAGCPRSTVSNYHETKNIEKLCRCDVVVMTCDQNWEQIFNPFAAYSTPKSLLIVEHIYQSKASYRTWKLMQQNEYVGVSFDLYDCGLLFFDRNMYKREYKVNL